MAKMVLSAGTITFSHFATSAKSTPNAAVSFGPGGLKKKIRETLFFGPVCAKSTEKRAFQRVISWPVLLRIGPESAVSVPEKNEISVRFALQISSLITKMAAPFTKTRRRPRVLGVLFRAALVSERIYWRVYALGELCEQNCFCFFSSLFFAFFQDPCLKMLPEMAWHFCREKNKMFSARIFLVSSRLAS